MKRGRHAARVSLCALGLGVLAWAHGPAALAQAGQAPDSVSLLQRVCSKHGGLKTAHLKFQSSLPEGWKEQSELWLDRPTRLNFHSKISQSTGTETVESHVLADGGKVTIWSSQPDPDRPEFKNVYMRQDAPPDVSSLFDSPARFGLGDFFLRLLSGEPNQLARATLSSSGRLDFERIIKGLGADQLALVSQDGKEQDELTFDVETSLLKEVHAKSDGKVVASGEVTYISINQPCEPGSFDWRVPQGAHEVKPPPQKPEHGK